MKKSIVLIIACALFNVVNAQESQVNETEVTITFDKPVHDFGRIQESGGLAECEFWVTNTGNQLLIITHVSTSCGCTASGWSKEPIAPGEKGFVKASFNPKGRNGNFVKSLTVFTSGIPTQITLQIKGRVEAASGTI